MSVIRLALFMIVALTAGSAFASNGVIEINNAIALVGGVTGGDAPGYPVTISERGSYRLTGNLTVTGVNPTNTNAITIASNDVTLDLNGFAIRCITGSFPIFTACSVTSGVGSGVSIVGDNVRVENGTIRDMAGSGVFVNPSHRYALDRLRVFENMGHGLHARDETTGEISHSLFRGNGGAGMRFDRELFGQHTIALISHTLTRSNGAGGIETPSPGAGVAADVALDTVFLRDAGHSEPGVHLLSCIMTFGGTPFATIFRVCPP